MLYLAFANIIEERIYIAIQSLHLDRLVVVWVRRHDVVGEVLPVQIVIPVVIVIARALQVLRLKVRWGDSHLFIDAGLAFVALEHLDDLSVPMVMLRGERSTTNVDPGAIVFLTDELAQVFPVDVAAAKSVKLLVVVRFDRVSQRWHVKVILQLRRDFEQFL